MASPDETLRDELVRFLTRIPPSRLPQRAERADGGHEALAKLPPRLRRGLRARRQRGRAGGEGASEESDEVDDPPVAGGSARRLAPKPRAGAGAESFSLSSVLPTAAAAAAAAAASAALPPQGTAFQRDLGAISPSPAR